MPHPCVGGLGKEEFGNGVLCAGSPCKGEANTGKFIERAPLPSGRKGDSIKTGYGVT